MLKIHRYVRIEQLLNPDQVLIAMLVGGPWVFFWGLRKLNEKRMIQNTPLSKVRSAAMGLIELQGMARQKAPQKSPLSHMDSCWWNCQIQELRSNGKSSSWYTLKQVGSNSLFYLEDPTGRVLVNPMGAEFHILKNEYPLNAGTRTQMAPVLNQWGIDDLNFIGGERTIRVIELVIPECAPLFVMGELISIGHDPADRKAKFMARLRAIKADRAKMADADTNHDGNVDAEEWEAFAAKQEEEFNKEEMTREAANPAGDGTLLTAPSQGPFIVSTQEQNSLVFNFSLLAPLAIFGGIAISALAVWWAISEHWMAWLIVAFLFVGFALSFFGKALGLGFERS